MSEIKTYQEEYENLFKLGEGGFAKVHKARHRTWGYICAVRRLKGNVTSETDKEYLNFIKECRDLLLISSGGHGNIAKISRPQLLYHTDERENQACVEMEYIKGLDIAKFIGQENNFIPAQEVINFVKDIGSALAYCHYDIYEFLANTDEEYTYELDSKLKNQKFTVTRDLNDNIICTPQQEKELVKHFKVLHNDIYASNIMRKYNGSYILVDFGLALHGDDKPRSSKKQAGVPQYWSPERFDNIMSERSDIYAFGCLAYYMLAGRLPYIYSEKDKEHSFEPEDVQLQRKHTKQAIPAIEPLRKAACENAGNQWKGRDYPDWLEKVVMKCLEKKPENRYVNGKELYEEVKSYIEKDSQAYSANSEEIGKLKELNKALTNDLSKLACEKQQLEEHISTNKPEWDNLTAIAEAIKTLKKENENLADENQQLKGRKPVVVEKIVEKVVRVPVAKPFWVIASILLFLVSGILTFTIANESTTPTPADTGQISQMQQQLNEEQMKVDSLNNQVTDLKKQLAASGSKSEFQKRIDEKDREIIDLKKKLTEAQNSSSTTTDLQRQITQLKEDKINLQKQLATAKSNSANNADLQKQVTTLKNTISQKEAGIKEKDTEIARLKKALAVALGN
jgi:serine/threonine-protein kinase